MQPDQSAQAAFAGEAEQEPPRVPRAPWWRLLAACLGWTLRRLRARRLPRLVVTLAAQEATLFGRRGSR